MNNQNKVLSYLYNQCKMEHFYYFWLRDPVHLVSAFPGWHNTQAEILSELETLSLTICQFLLFCSKGPLRTHVHMAIGHMKLKVNFLLWLSPLQDTIEFMMCTGSHMM